jgi:hypothetical protein
MDLQASLVNTKTAADALPSVKLLKIYPIFGTFALIEREGEESLVHLASYPGLFESLDKTGLENYSPKELMPQILASLDTMSKGRAEAGP